MDKKWCFAGWIISCVFLLVIIILIGTGFVSFSPQTKQTSGIKSGSSVTDNEDFDCQFISEEDIEEPLDWDWCQENGYACDEYWEDPIECFNDANQEYVECRNDCDHYNPYGTEAWCNCVNYCLQGLFGNQRGCFCHQLQSENC